RLVLPPRPTLFPYTTLFRSRLHLLDVARTAVLQQLLGQHAHGDRHVLQRFLALLRGDDQRVEGGGLAFARGRRLLRGGGGGEAGQRGGDRPGQHVAMRVVPIDRKSTRLNSSHV